MTESRAEKRLRLFVAVDLPAHVRREVSAASVPLRVGTEHARWTDPHGWHLTLAFLGWVHPGTVGPVTAALREVASGSSPFTLTLDGCAGTFGHRVLWVGLEHSVELEQLARRAQEALEPLGFPVEDRPFHPHLTLARSPRDQRLPRGIAQRYRGPKAHWHVAELALMRSELARSGARYLTEARLPLGR